jgi:hypothetical protein
MACNSRHTAYEVKSLIFHTKLRWYIVLSLRCPPCLAYLLRLTATWYQPPNQASCSLNEEVLDITW